MREFPKLPQQDDFLINLQNNNYSMMTVISYARDLCIFAVFLDTNRKTFDEIDKGLINDYKGYLRTGDHLQDLDRARNEFLFTDLNISENSDFNEEDFGKRLKINGLGEFDSKKVDNSTEKTVASSNASKIDSNSQSESEVLSKNKFLASIYKKVYATLFRIPNSKVQIPKGSHVHHGRVSSGIAGGLDARSINRMLSALRSFFKYRIDMDLEIPVPPDVIKMIKADRKKSQVAEFDELVKLLECPNQFEKDFRVAIRNRAMLEILFSTGMRISELMSLNLDQINAQGKLFIMGKGRKQRFVYVTPRALGWLNEYLKVRLKFGVMEFQNSNSKIQIGEHQDNTEFVGGSNNLTISIDGEIPNDKIRETTESVTVSQKDESSFTDESFEKLMGLSLDLSQENAYVLLLEKLRSSGYIKKFRSPALFIPFSGRGLKKNGGIGYRLSTNLFQEKIAEYRHRLGILVPTSAHSLRHGFATYLAENGASAVAIQVLLGHESLNTTTRYVHGSDKFAQDTHTKMFPLK